MTPFGPRPFYVVGHNPDSISAVSAALNAGANAIEPDVNVYENQPGALCISEGGALDMDRGGKPNAPSLAAYLTDLHQIAIEYPALALVVFDCKAKVAGSAALGKVLLDEIRNRLTHDTELNVILSVSSRRTMEIFTEIAPLLGPREGLMVDGENDPVAVSNAFETLHVENRCFGNGISLLNTILGPHVLPSMEQACAYRASTGKVRFIYAWTVNDAARMREHIRAGVDGIITDQPATLRGVVNEPEFQQAIRYATRADNPLRPANCAYGLTVQTSNRLGAGTDSRLSFTLAGSKGTASVTVDSSLNFRMERGDTNHITLPSDDLGYLQTLAVQSDLRGFAADWFVDRVIVTSARYNTSKTAEFNRWIDARSPAVKANLV